MTSIKTRSEYVKKQLTLRTIYYNFFLEGMFVYSPLIYFYLSEANYFKIFSFHMKHFQLFMCHLVFFCSFHFFTLLHSYFP